MDSGPVMDTKACRSAAKGGDGRGVPSVRHGSDPACVPDSGKIYAVVAEECPNEQVGELKVSPVLGGGGGGAGSGISTGVGGGVIGGAQMLSGFIQPPSPDDESGNIDVFDTALQSGERGGGGGVDPGLAPTPRMTIPGFRGGGPNDAGAATTPAASAKATFSSVNSDSSGYEEEEKEGANGPAGFAAPAVPPRVRSGALVTMSGPHSPSMAIQVSVSWLQAWWRHIVSFVDVGGEFLLSHASKRRRRRPRLAGRQAPSLLF